MADQRLQSTRRKFLSRSDQERATESGFHLARDRRNGRVWCCYINPFGLRTAAVSQIRWMHLALQAACEPSRAWRKRDLRKGPSHGGNTSGSRADETFRTTSTGPLALCNIATAASSSLTCLTVAVWRKPQVSAMPARSTPALVWVGCMPVSP